MRAQGGEPQVDAQPLVVVAAARVRFAQRNEGIDEIGIRGEELLVERDFKIEEFVRFAAFRHDVRWNE